MLLWARLAQLLQLVGLNRLQGRLRARLRALRQVHRQGLSTVSVLVLGNSAVVKRGLVQLAARRVSIAILRASIILNAFQGPLQWPRSSRGGMQVLS